jgi:hypothetical protein
MTTLSQPEARVDTLRETVKFLDGWKKKKRTKRKFTADPFFKLVINKKRTAAEKVLIRLTKKAEPSLWHIGYITALRGMIAALETRKNQSLFIHRVDGVKPNKYRKTFIQRAKHELLNDFDRGYFSAWADYMYALTKSSA